MASGARSLKRADPRAAPKLVPEAHEVRCSTTSPHLPTKTKIVGATKERGRKLQSTTFQAFAIGVRELSECPAILRVLRHDNCGLGEATRPR
eukprot:6220201-Alexandrium_andersonii.AAC.1